MTMPRDATLRPLKDLDPRCGAAPTWFVLWAAFAAAACSSSPEPPALDDRGDAAGPDAAPSDDSASGDDAGSDDSASGDDAGSDDSASGDDTDGDDADSDDADSGEPTDAGDGRDASRPGEGSAGDAAGPDAADDAPAPDDASVDDLAQDDPAADDPAGDDPAGDDPAADDPAGDDPAVDDPAADDPAADDPAADDDIVTDDGEPPEPGTIAHQSIDLSPLAGSDGFVRVYGTPEGDGSLGVPVAGAADLDGDGNIDSAMSSFGASPLGRYGAGQVYVLFGNGAIAGDVDQATESDRLLMILGDGNLEATGSELAMADVTGDGVGDLLIARQNYRADEPDRIGAGALTIIVGGPHLREQLDAGQPIDLREPPDSVPVVTFVGQMEIGRLGIWMRTADITADGIDDLVVGADQEALPEEAMRGAAYVIRGGEHLASSLVVDLIDFGTTPLEGHIAKITPPLGESAGYHFGATVGVADLDRNGRAEVIGAAALVRSGATLPAEDGPVGSAIGQGGAPGGRAYIVWDDNFPDGDWPAGYAFHLGAPPASVTTLLPGQIGDLRDRQLGEEIIGGKDYDGDGRPDLFIGDMTGIAGPGRSNAGIGYVIYDAGALKQRQSVVLMDPGDVPVTRILGPSPGAIFADTAAHADFDGDGMTDLVIASPNASPLGRVQAGIAHVLWGNPTRWPAEIDLANKPAATAVQITELLGVRGASGADGGDMLSYSADVGDLDGDGRLDLLINEMGGNGLGANAIDAGNYLILSSEVVARGRPDCSGVLGGAARVDACGVCAGGTTGVPPDSGCVSFSREVLPLLLGECSSCHGNAGGLSVFSHELLLLGTSEHGPVISPGDPTGSLLIQKLEATQPVGDPMPPEYRLSAEEIGVIRSWVEQGARDN